ncbi:MAG TPA: HD domain-containing protein [Candidatus Aminicenantes bacterium]|nr:HD domain-containing protein [Candidatus Aminicenantes bacterium]
MERSNVFKHHLKVEIRHLIPRSVVGFNIFMEKNGKLLLYKPGGETISEEHIERMLAMGSEFLFIEEEERREVMEYYEANLDTMLKSEHIPPPQKSRILHSVTESIVEKSFAKPENPANLPKWEKSVRDSFSFILDNQDVFESMITIAEKDAYTYTHSVNVSLLLMGFAIDSGLQDSQEIQRVGLGGLLHDLGKAEVPDPILKKPGALSMTEWLVMQKHPEIGVRLSQFHPQISEQSRVIIAQHHESVRGTGYPKKLTGDRIDYWGRVCKIVDAYDALTSNRPYSFAVTPVEALKKMIAADTFDKRLLRHFIHFLNLERMNSLRDRFMLLAPAPAHPG